MTSNLKTVTASKADLEQAQASLRESEQRWATTLASIGDAVIATDLAGKIPFMNGVAEELTGWKLSEASQRPVKETFNIVNEQTRLEVESPVDRVLKEGIIVGLANHTVLIRKDGTEIPIDDSGAPIKDKDGKTSGIVLIFRDIRERKQVEAEREIMIEFLRITNTQNTTQGLVAATADFFKKQSDCEAVGIRLKDGEDFPYYEVRGFPTEHVEMENKLCARDAAGCMVRDFKGDPVIECMCGNVICGRFDPSKEFFSEKGSFWANDTTQLLATSTDSDRQARTRNRCNGEGYESVALLALRIGDQRLGLLQLNDKRKNMFTLENIQMWERIADQLALALSKTLSEEAMRESEERFSKAFHSSPVPQIITRFGDWRYVDANESVLRLLEYSREELLGHTSAELNLISADQRTQGVRTVNDGGELRDFETSVRTKSGKILTLLASTEAVTIKGEKHLINTFIDVTMRKQMQAKLEEYSKHLEDLVAERTKQLKDSERLAAIGATAGMVGHDIRNPLQAITGDVYLAKTELAAVPESPEKKNALESLQEIEKNIEYINKIVADLQDFARPLKPHLEDADLQVIITELLAKSKLPKNVKVNVKVDAEAKKVVADSAYLNRILYNLVTNAVQAMPQGGKLTIHASRDKKTKEAVLTVADTGVGIPENAKGKLFTPMFTTKSKGQGFGLAVIKRMAEALSGSVSFESQEGKGTKFTIRLPQNVDKKKDF
ncbi:MAG: PAS domain S-box protein [Chloroflexi bacterium]|nr:PAS domain S-box protein [Chloroflexota bacterium]